MYVYIYILNFYQNESIQYVLLKIFLIVVKYT